MRLPIGPGIDSIPTDTIPSDPEQFVAWFKSVGLKRWFANADVRNATEGPGIAIAGSISTSATVSVTSELMALLEQPYVLVGSPVAPAVLSDYRSLAVEPNVLTSIDGGPESTVTLGVATNGIGNTQLRQGAANSVIGNPTGSTANVEDLSQAQLTALVNEFTPLLSGAVPPPGTPAGNFLRDDGTWDAAGAGVTSVGLADTSTAPIYTITNSPVTSSGTIDIALKTQTANTIFAGPGTGAAGQPSFRPLNAADIATLGGGAAQVPATIAGLLYWFDASILAASFPTGTGNGLPLLGSPDPYRAPGSAFVAGAGNGAFLDTTTLNGLPVFNFGGSAASQYTLNSQIITPAQTIFVVFKPASLAAQSNFIGGITSSIALGVQTTGAVQLQITNTIGIASSTALLSAGTWAQFNTAYDGATYSYRVNRTADVSGSSSHIATQPQTGFGWNGSTSNQPANGLIAEFIFYNRKLTLAQIQVVENYLHTKWGV